MQFEVKRIAGSPGEHGTLQLTDDMGETWRVPCIESPVTGKLAVAQNEYACLDRDVEPGMMLVGDMNDACRLFLASEVIES